MRIILCDHAIENSGWHAALSAHFTVEVWTERSEENMAQFAGGGMTVFLHAHRQDEADAWVCAANSCGASHLVLVRSQGGGSGVEDSPYVHTCLWSAGEFQDCARREVQSLVSTILSGAPEWQMLARVSVPVWTLSLLVLQSSGTFLLPSESPLRTELDSCVGKMKTELKFEWSHWDEWWKSRINSLKAWSGAGDLIPTQELREKLGLKLSELGLGRGWAP